MVISASRAQNLASIHVIPSNGRYCHSLPVAPTPKHPGFPVPVLVVAEKCSLAAQPQCTTVINVWLHILTSQPLCWSCHDCVPLWLASKGLRPEMHPRTQTQQESLDSNSNHDTLPTHLNPTSNRLCTNPSCGWLPVSFRITSPQKSDSNLSPSWSVIWDAPPLLSSMPR